MFENITVIKHVIGHKVRRRSQSESGGQFFVEKVQSHGKCSSKSETFWKCLITPIIISTNE